MDEIAEALGIDPLEFRNRNMLRRGEHVRSDLRPIDVEMGEAMDIATKEMSRLKARDGGNITHSGTALGISDPGIMPVASIVMRLKIDGSVQDRRLGRGGFQQRRDRAGRSRRAAHACLRTAQPARRSYRCVDAGYGDCAL